jgi:hypothetical protein
MSVWPQISADAHTAEATTYADDLDFPPRLAQDMFADRNPAVGLERRTMRYTVGDPICRAVGHTIALRIVGGGVNPFAGLNRRTLFNPLLRLFICNAECVARHCGKRSSVSMTLMYANYKFDLR